MKRIYKVIAVITLALCLVWSGRVVYAKYLFFDGLKNSAQDLRYSIERNNEATDLAPHRPEFHYVSAWYDTFGPRVRPQAAISDTVLAGTHCPRCKARMSGAVATDHETWLAVYIDSIPVVIEPLGILEWSWFVSSGYSYIVRRTWKAGCASCGLIWVSIDWVRRLTVEKYKRVWTEDVYTLPVVRRLEAQRKKIRANGSTRIRYSF